MKIRNGFVSNSSSSSFCIYGVSINKKELIEKMEKINKEITEEDKEDIWSFLYQEEKDLFVSEGPYDYSGNIYIGKSWSSIRDDQTGKEFKEETQQRLKKLTGEEIRCCTIEEAWRND